jgi:hypothetical protein
MALGASCSSIWKTTLSPFTVSSDPMTSSLLPLRWLSGQRALFGTGHGFRVMADTLRSTGARLVGQMFTLDKRRLIAFQEAGVPAPFRMATASEITKDAFKFRTQNE